MDTGPRTPGLETTTGAALRSGETDLNGLLLAVAERDRAAFDAFVVATRQGVMGLLRRLVAPSSVEDALQDAYVAVWRSAESYRGEASAKSWLYGIARRRAARTWRRRAGEPMAMVPLHELGAQAGWGRDPESLTQAHEDADRVHHGLDLLSEHDREVVVLCDLEGLSGPEAADVLGITPNATRVRLHRARLRLMAVLQEEAHGDA